MNSLQGHLLVASPHLADPNFFRTVILMVQHDEEGALGLVLNRPSESSVAEIWTQLQQKCECTDPVYVGGPCPGPLMALHTRVECAEEQVLGDVYFATRREHLNKLVAKSRGFRIFSGYAGWAPGQLEAELKEGSWLTIEADPELVFNPAADLWQNATKKVAADVLYSSLGIERRPTEPGLN